MADNTEDHSKRKVDGVIKRVLSGMKPTVGKASPFSKAKTVSAKAFMKNTVNPIYKFINPATVLYHDFVFSLMDKMGIKTARERAAFAKTVLCYIIQETTKHRGYILKTVERLVKCT
jgi:hypothetical protein